MRALLTTLLIGLSLSSLEVAADTEKEKRVRDYPFEQVAENSWVIHGPLGHPTVENQGFMNNPGMVVTRAGVVLVDPGSSVLAGEMVLRMVKKVTDAPVVATFNTHVHGDHWLGNQAIRAAYPDAPIYAHPNMVSEAESGKGDQWRLLIERQTEGLTRRTRVELPDQLLNHGDELRIGDHTFRIHHYGQAHTNSDMMVEVVEEGVVFLGDNVMSNRLGGMQEGTFLGNMQTLKRVLESGAKVWVPGHGATAGAEVVTTYRDYLKTVYGGALLAFEEGMESDQLKPLIVERAAAYRDWVGYSLEIGRHAGHAYLEVESNEF